MEKKDKTLETISSKGYYDPDILVTTEWVAEHLNDPDVRIIESNEDQLLYSLGHIPGAVHVDWTTDLNDPVQRDYLHKTRFEKLMSGIGVSNNTTIVLYGDKNNWWACYAFWVFKLFNHQDLRIMDGGRVKWDKENREMVRTIPSYPKTNYIAPQRDDLFFRAFRHQVAEHVNNGNPLIDVRSWEEYTGERLHMPNYPNEGALRGGHIPGAANIPWSRAVNTEDGTFKTASELRDIYEEEQALNTDDDIIVYCRIGERSSHTWFVLRYLLGYKKVRNYDGSWTEWGNLVGAPIEK